MAGPLRRPGLTDKRPAAFSGLLRSARDDGREAATFPPSLRGAKRRGNPSPRLSPDPRSTGLLRSARKDGGEAATFPPSSRGAERRGDPSPRLSPDPRSTGLLRSARKDGGEAATFPPSSRGAERRGDPSPRLSPDPRSTGLLRSARKDGGRFTHIMNVKYKNQQTSLCYSPHPPMVDPRVALTPSGAVARP